MTAHGQDLMAAGTARNSSSSGRIYALSIDSSGRRDTGFDDDGVLLLPRTTMQARFTTTGRVYAVLKRAGAARGEFILARYSRRGTLDQNFSGDGRVRVTGCASGSNLRVIVNPSGLPVVYCQRSGSPSAMLVRRFTSTGVLDRTFSDDGTAFVDDCCQIAIDAEGRLLVASAGFGTDLTRLNRAGSLDTDFSNDGKATIDGFVIGGSYDAIFTAPGRIYVVDDRLETLAVQA